MEGIKGKLMAINNENNPYCIDGHTNNIKNEAGLNVCERSALP